MKTPPSSPPPAEPQPAKVGPSTDKEVTEEQEFVTTESKEDPLSLYRVEGARHTKENDTLVQLRRRGKQRRALGMLADHWDHIYIVKGQDSKRHNKIHWSRLTTMWEEGPK
ncbi:MAG: hypothetical protein AB2660_18640, partial [Candidatus Thiodiazotropha sp.]